MDFLVRMWQKFTGTPAPQQSKRTNSGNGGSIIQATSGNKTKPGEIGYLRELSDEQIRATENRKKYIKVTPNPDYTIKKGDGLDKIARMHHVSKLELMQLNGLKENSILRIGQKIKIPPTRKATNVRTLQDIAKAMGVSIDFVKKLKRAEDGSSFGDDKFHTTPYTDKAGNKTIGIGHLYRKGEKAELTNEEVCELCANDLLRVEEDVSAYLGQNVYKKLPSPIKEAILDMVFNKGMEIFDKSPGLAYNLKNGNYEAAINKMTFNRSMKTNEEMAGLSKRRLLDISIAIRVYPENAIPLSNVRTAQEVYNRGVALLREECRKEKSDFKTQLEGFNKDIKSYFGNKIKLKYITE